MGEHKQSKGGAELAAEEERQAALQKNKQ